MKALILASTVLFAAPAIAATPFENEYKFELKQCGLANDVQRCAIKLAACEQRVADKLEKEGPTPNLGMAITYHCLEEQNVKIPGVDE